MSKNISIPIGGLAALLILHFFAIFLPAIPILLTPFYLGLFTVFLFFFTDFRPIIKFLIILVTIITNDIWIKLMDSQPDFWSESRDFIGIFLFFGLVLSFFPIMTYGFKLTNKRKPAYFLYMILAGFLIWNYCNYFYDYRVVWKHLPTKSLEESKKDKLFISNVSISDSILRFNNDTFLIRKAWIEHEIHTNHMGIIKKIEKTGRVSCSLIITGNFKGLHYLDIYYKLNGDSSSTVRMLSKIISFPIDKKLAHFDLDFYNSDWKKIKELEIKTY